MFWSPVNYWICAMSCKRKWKLPPLHILECWQILNNAGTKKTGEAVGFPVLLSRWRATTFRDARRRLSASCGLWRGVKPVRDGRSCWPSSHGNHACALSCDCGAGMFFSSLLLLLFNSFPPFDAFPVWRKPPCSPPGATKQSLFYGLGCKSTHFFSIHQEFVRIFAEIHVIFQ